MNKIKRVMVGYLASIDQNIDSLLERVCVKNQIPRSDVINLFEYNDVLWLAYWAPEVPGIPDSAVQEMPRSK